MGIDLRAQLQRALGDNYLIERELAPGGMSRLFLATESALERSVVVKLLPPELASEVSAERFRREMLLTARLQHPNILTVLHAGFTEGLLFYVTPYVGGETLRSRLLREPKIPIPEAVRVLSELAGALACAHEAGIVHRDVKPDNVLLEHGHAVLADFGVARAIEQATLGEPLTGTDLRIGTPGYMAPEQLAADKPVDARADLYALGVVAFEMLAGESPFPGRSAQGLIAAHLAEPAGSVRSRRPEVSPELATLIARMLAKAPEDRPSSAGEIATVLGDVSSSNARTHGTWASNSRLLAIVISLALVGFVGARLVSRGLTKSLQVASAVRSDSGNAAAGRANSLAVLPFVNLSGDLQNDYISDGMTEELIDALAKVDGLSVAARNSSFAFKTTKEDVSGIGKKLHVRAVVEGSVRKQGKRIRVTAQLVDVDSGYQLWSASYDRDSRDVLEVQAQISRAIVSALRTRLQLKGRGEILPPRVGTKDVEAHDFYLRGRYLWNQRTSASLASAERYFLLAIRRDSSYAQAYSALADTYLLEPVLNASMRPREVFRRAKTAAMRAVALDSTLASAHAASGYVDVFNYDWEAAGAEFQTALALDPHDATVRSWYGSYLNALGRYDEAEVQIRRALELEPLSRILGANLASQFVLTRKYDEALRQVSATLELDPNFSAALATSCYVRTMRREFTKAIPECERALELGGRDNWGLGQLAYTYGAAGDTMKALKVLSELKVIAARGYLGPLELTYANLGLGRKAEALFWLDSAIKAHDPNLINFMGDPMLDPLRKDPRYPAVVAGLKLPAPSQQSVH